MPQRRVGGMPQSCLTGCHGGCQDLQNPADISDWLTLGGILLFFTFSQGIRLHSLVDRHEEDLLECSYELKKFPPVPVTSQTCLVVLYSIFYRVWSAKEAFSVVTVDLASHSSSSSLMQLLPLPHSVALNSLNIRSN